MPAILPLPAPDVFRETFGYSERAGRTPMNFAGTARGREGPQRLLANRTTIKRPEPPTHAGCAPSKATSGG
ncbi:Uncharacterised protein [Amycolatopsis camponoti]|uniref:Uncharacterized protein n=1 Tax=Amycolatopsis camponoti TaxID=2606593 RepID=A0A6I8LXR5_9PSEU|nr:Uncharacterised protein [Amycolatopsis camponoti]